MSDLVKAHLLGELELARLGVERVRLEEEADLVAGVEKVLVASLEESALAVDR